MKTEKLKKLIAAFGIWMFVVPPAGATILWVGGEGGDFEVNPFCVSNTGFNPFRSGYARLALYNCNSSSIGKSIAFKSGGITSGWFSGRVMPYSLTTSLKWFGFGKSGTNNGLLVGTSALSSSKAAIWKLSNGVWTELASEAGTSFLVGSAMYKVDMQIMNYGASATVKVYINAGANPVISYAGDVSTTSADLDSAFAVGGTSAWGGISEFIVADQDTRMLSVATLTPNAIGDTNQWTGAYTDIDEFPASDTDMVTTTTDGSIFQSNLGNLPAGSWQVYGAKLNIRGAKVGAGISSVSLGLKTNSSAYVPTPLSLGTTWLHFETPVFNTNPITTTNWTPTEINALQLHLQAAP